MAAWWRSLRRDEDGQDMVEYVLVMAFVSVAAVSALELMGVSIGTFWSTLSTEVGAAFE